MANGDDVALIDMDGTLCDYDGAMSYELEKLRSPGETYDFQHGGEWSDWYEARRAAVSRIPGFWRNLKPLPVGMEIYYMLQELQFDLNILTKGPSTKPIAWSEKLEWCREFVPEAHVTVTEDKSLVYGKLLVDDWPSYYQSWLKWRPRGYVVVPAQPWNVDAEKFAPGQIFRYDGTNPDRLFEILSFVKVRELGKHTKI